MQLFTSYIKCPSLVVRIVVVVVIEQGEWLNNRMSAACLPTCWYWITTAVPSTTSVDVLVAAVDTSETNIDASVWAVVENEGGGDSKGDNDDDEWMMIWW